MLTTKSEEKLISNFYSTLSIQYESAPGVHIGLFYSH